MPEKQPPSILVVDDEPGIRELLFYWLTAEGYDCSTASDAEMALQMMQNQEFHLVLSDIMMPGMSGIDLLTAIIKRYPATAVVMATGVDDRKTAIATLQLGAYGYVIKPFDKNEILINVVNALERRRLNLVSREYERSLEARLRLNEKYRTLVQVYPAGIAEFALPKPVSCAAPAEELLRLLFNAAISHANPEFARLGGYENAEQLTGVRCGEVFPQAEEYLGEYLAWIDDCFATRSFETKESAANGELQYFEYTLVGNVRNDFLTVFWGMRRDITARMQVQEALADKIRTIDDLYEHILHAGKAKAIAEHTAEVAHELRQPLAIIGGFARRIAREAAAGETLDAQSLEESIRIIIREIQRLEEILSGLIDFTRHEGVQLKGVNPHELITYVIGINQPRLEARGVQVETRFGDEAEEILVDPDRFQQVVRNLLANAIEASPLGSVVRIETGIATLSEQAHKTGGLDSDAYFEMKIHNNGKTILAEVLQKIFDPFFTTKDYGTGMGLTLSKKIIDDHHGSMSVRSDEEGTLFTVWLPMGNPKARDVGTGDTPVSLGIASEPAGCQD